MKELWVGRGGSFSQACGGSGKSGTHRQELSWVSVDITKQVHMELPPQCQLSQRGFFPDLTLPPGDGVRARRVSCPVSRAGLGVSGWWESLSGLGSSPRDHSPEGSEPLGQTQLGWTPHCHGPGYREGGLWVGWWGGWRLHSGAVPDLTAQSFKCPGPNGGIFQGGS